MQKIEWNNVSNHPTASDSCGFLLWKTQLIWRRIIETKLRDHDLTHPQFVILTSLAYLTKEGNSLTQVELANHTSCDVTTTSQILRALERKGLIKRISLRGNEKSKYPFLTDEGYIVFRSAIKTVENTDHEFFNKLNASELEVIGKILLKLSS